jgi:hypothetical protein
MKARCGMALVLAIVVLLLIELMAAGMIALASQARLIAAGQGRMARADARAHSAVRAVLTGFDVARHDSLPLLHVAPAPGTGDVSWSTTVERLSSGSFLIRAFAEAGVGAAYSRTRAIAVARTLDRRAALRTLNVALASGGPAVLAGGARVSAAESLPAGWSAAGCEVPSEDLGPAGALLTARPPVIGLSATVYGDVAIDTASFPNDSVALGAVRWRQLEPLADRIERGALTPAPPPALEGPCEVTAAANWGDPDRAGAPCFGWFPLIYAPGDLRVAGGTGQGVLLVAGRLTLEGGARFVGVIVAGDGVSIEEGVSVVGSIRSTGGPALLSGGDVRFSGCAVSEALRRAPGARRLILNDRTFIPPF